MLLSHKPYLAFTCLFVLALFFLGSASRAQTIYLSPDTVKICSGATEEFEIELRADAQITGMALYSAFISFDKDMLELSYVFDTTYWQCNGWDYDSTCTDPICVEWAYTDSTCIATECTEWDLDSTAIDSICSEWDLDSTAIDSICTDMILDSTCLLYQCIEYDTLSICIDSQCVIAEVDTTCIGEWEPTEWQVDSNCIGTWTHTEWQVDSACLYTDCIEYEYTDSSCIAYDGCNEWYVDSTCNDSTETTPENADFMTEDTISYAIEEGPLLRDAPGAESVMFFQRMTSDSTTLIIESVIFWPKVSVDGPGLLATIRLKNKGSGIMEMVIDSVRVLDINTNPIPVTSTGSTFLLNNPPDSFGLLLPTQGSVIEVDLGDTISFSWEPSQVHCPGDSVLYELIVSDQLTFTGLSTFSVPEINATEHKLDAYTELWDGSVYWKVRSYNTLGSEIYSDEYFYFTLDIAAQPPGNFNLLIPRHDSLLNVIGKDTEYFSWSEPSTVIPDDTLRFGLYIDEAAEGSNGSRMIIDDIMQSETSVDIDSFLLYIDYTWQVKCTNRVGLSTWSDDIFAALFYLRGDANGDGSINVGDAVFIINYVFKHGTAPMFLDLGDANCDGSLNVGDAVFLINYVFKSGLPPCSN